MVKLFEGGTAGIEKLGHYKNKACSEKKTSGKETNRKNIRREFTVQCYILGQWLPKTAAFDAGFDLYCTA
jgi:hypothetical protein